MHANKSTIDHVMMNFELLYDLLTMLALFCILPMMNALDYLMKFNQDCKCFIGDMTPTIKIFYIYMYVCICIYMV